MDREESSETAPREPSTILHGHSLGVTAVDTNDGIVIHVICY